MSVFLDSLSEFSYASTERGRNYYLEGRVLSLKVNDYTCTATVKGSGTHLYKVTIRFSRKFEMTNHNCSCPVGHYCKHTVAALYKLDRMLDNGELIFANQENTSSWQEEVDNIFLKYFSNRYHFNPNYGPLNVYLKNNESILKKETEDVIYYIVNRVLDYFFNYHYDLGYIVRFFDMIITSYLSREQYSHILERFKEKKDSFIMTLGIFLKIDTVSMATNQFISKCIDEGKFVEYVKNNADVFYVNELTSDNIIKIAKLCPQLFNQRSLEERISQQQNVSFDNEKRLELIYALLLAYLAKGKFIHNEYYQIIEKIKKVNVDYYRNLMLELFLKARLSHDFVSLITSFRDYKASDEVMDKLTKMSNKPFYVNIYLHKPVSLENVPLNEIVELFAIENFFEGYESYLTELALKKINHAKKLKNYDLDIINGLTVLDYLKYDDLIALIFDKNIKEKFIDNFNRFYYYLLFKHDLLDAIGYKKYGIIG